MKKLALVLAGLAILGLIAAGMGCSQQIGSITSPAPTSTLTVTPSSTLTATPTPAAGPVVTPSSSPTPAVSRTLGSAPTPGPAISPVPSAKSTAAPAPEATPTVTPSTTPSPTPTPLLIPPEEEHRRRAPTPTATPSPTPSPTPTPFPTPVTGVDDMGRPFEFSSPPQRIVSHVPSITETLFALGLDERIVGVSTFCDYPEEANSKLKIGGYFNPNIEAIVALEPDLVLTDGYVADIARLDNYGIPWVVVQPMDLDWVFRDIELLGRITGTEQTALAITNGMRDRVNAVVDTVGNATRLRVFYVFDATDTTKPWTAGPGSFVDNLIQLGGGENIAAEAQGPWVQFSVEDLVRLDPEVILVDSMHGTAVISPEAIKQLPGWKETTAAKEDRIYIIDGDLVNRTGPRIVQGLEDIARAIHPELPFP